MARRLPALLLHGVLPLLLGGAVYVLWRSERLLMFDWFQSLGLTQAVVALRQGGVGASLPVWVLYSLPDGAWVYAASATVSLIWADSPGLSRTLWLSVAVTVAVLSELGQALGVVPGTFDVVDLLTYLGAHIAALWATSYCSTR